MAFKKLLYQLKKYKEGYVSSYIKEVLTYANQAKEDIKRRMKLYTSEC